MAHISDQVPEHWVKVLKPYLLRAREFEAREPPVAYFLKTYVAHEAMKLRKKDDAAGSKFLMALLDHCEAERSKLGESVNTADGRTVLTKAALMLFSKADDLERVGQANQGIVKLFFASSQLFEATSQFTKEGKLDPIAQEKSKYAKYIAFRMKKALDSGAPYVSPNELETPDTQDPPTLPPNDPAFNPTPGAAPPAAAAGAYQQPVVPAPAPTAEMSPPSGFPQIPTNQSIDSNPYQPQPPRDHYQGAPTVPAPATNPAYQQQPIPAPAPAPVVQPAPPVPVVAQPAPVPAPVAAAPPTPGAGGGPAPDMDQMMKAQKFAKQAVAALQFFDHQNAREQLVAAIRALDGSQQ